MKLNKVPGPESSQTRAYYIQEKHGNGLELAVDLELLVKFLGLKYQRIAV